MIQTQGKYYDDLPLKGAGVDVIIVHYVQFRLRHAACADIGKTYFHLGQA